MRGTFVCIVGPSGVGKDTLIAGARQILQGDERFMFPRRIITRDASSAEDHDTISADKFAAMQAEGAFAVSWAAHGLHYAIPGLMVDELREGHVAVCNLSRAAIADARRRFSSVRVVLVTAPRQVLHERLLGRGREASGDLYQRLQREADSDVAADLTISNVGALEGHVATLVGFLRDLAAERRARD